MQKRLRIKIYGVVQGVGFRPFVRNLACNAGVAGSVRNAGPYVEIIAESGEPELAAFLHSLTEQAPARAEILKTEALPEEPQGLVGFEILGSSQGGGGVYPSPDIGICDSCKKELFDPGDRRYLHPFINCTACGPRLTILDSMPYDRERTSMAGFEMCPGCAREYAQPSDRRFHAQPVCCPECGPLLRILGREDEPDPVAVVRAVIRGGGIAAVKGIGGFHLCCDATNSGAVARLRQLKHRPAKPFAVMAADMAAAKRECLIDAAAEKLLDGPAKPIVLLKKLAGGLACDGVAPGNPSLGLMLPYAPVQLLLFGYPDGRGFTDCLVMTSGNASGSPICITDAQALGQLAPMCDIILSNDREIRLRADDSVMAVYGGAPYMLRRSRGFAPLPFEAHKKAQVPIFAAGGELKNTFCIASGDRLYLSPYIGDLTDIRSVDALDEARVRLTRLLEVSPQAAVCDLHPLYNSSSYARGLGLPVLAVQHHFAHIAACMAENGLDGEVIGVSFDGTGYGSDGGIWGGEFLRVSYKGFGRLGSLEPFALQGGDRAALEGWRPALSLLLAALGDKAAASKAALELGLCGEAELAAVLAALEGGVNCAPTTSAGRLFDAVSAILGICRSSSFEGEAAMALEFAASRCGGTPEQPIILPKIPFEISVRSMIKYIVGQRLAGGGVNALAAYFHTAAAQMVAAGCQRSRELTGLNRVALSGGCFQNLPLLGLCSASLEKAGFEVFCHAQVPPNDGGLALGQAAIATEHFQR